MKADDLFRPLDIKPYIVAIERNAFNVVTGIAVLNGDDVVIARVNVHAVNDLERAMAFAEQIAALGNIA